MVRVVAETRFMLLKAQARPASIIPDESPGLAVADEPELGRSPPSGGLIGRRRAGWIERKRHAAVALCLKLV